MSRYSPEERAAIVARTAATLQRGEADHEQPSAPMHDLPREDMLAEALQQPVEDRVANRRREAEEQEQRFARERRRRERGAQPAPVNWDLRISEAVASERLFMTQVLAEAFAELTERQREAIESAVRPLQAELAQVRAEAAEQKVRICELQLSNGSLREQLAGGHAIDLPALPLRSSRAN